MSFPLADWINAGRGVPHNLAQSGMIGQLRTVPRALRVRLPPDEAALRAALGRLHDVDVSRVFLTHGATEGNSLALTFLAQRARKHHARPPRVRLRVPEYPPIGDAAGALGYRPVPLGDAADVFALSDPSNPEGRCRSGNEVARLASGCPRVVIDETFREFSGRPSHVRDRRRGWWVVGSFTKSYGADDHRVGFVIPAAEDARSFATFHGLVTDRLPGASISAARALLASRQAIMGEARGILRSNLTVLRRAVKGVGELAAPLWFDRGMGGLGGDRMADTMLRHGVLVCPGSYFGDPGGVRVCLTQRSFPADLAAYLTVRERLLARSPRGRSERPRRRSVG